MAMDRESLFEKIRTYFKGEVVEQVFVFGSFADDTTTRRSDLDLIVIKKSGKRFVERLREYLDVDTVLGLPVDLLVYTPNEWKTVGKRKFFANHKLLRVL